MNLVQLEKLKSLISVSTILNSAEKQEWHQLLELMNDKQIHELEKILMSAEPLIVTEASAVQTPEEKPKSFAAIPQVRPQIAPPPQTPSVKKPAMGHIVNLPQAPKAPTKPQPLAAAVKTTVPSPKEDKGFVKYLKNILREPELPPGRPDNELELTDGGEHSILKLKPQATAGLNFPLKPLPVVPRPAPAVLPVTPTLKTPPVQPAATSAAPSLVQKPVKPYSAPSGGPEKSQTVPLKSLVASLAPAAAKKTLAQETADEQEGKVGIKAWPSFYDLKKGPPTAGAMASSSVQKSSPPPVADLRPLTQPTTVANILKSHPAAPNAFSQASNQPAFTGQLRQPKDLEGLTANELRPMLDKKVKELVKTFGYFEVISHLEKSPVYKNYLDTGRVALQKNADLDALSKSQTGILNRLQFEMTVDLLRIIQAE